MSLRSTFFFIGMILLLSGCSQIPDQPNYRPSSSLPDYQQSNFSDYVQETRVWLETNRVFLTADKQAELTANAPFEVKPFEVKPFKVKTTSPEKPSRGILLVHGLGDSPGYFTDLATELSQQGFLVRSMLLPGHGSKPADLMLPDISDWEKAVQHQARLLAQEVDEVWLGGFSTGGNLVTKEALENDQIKGLVLFSPGFEPKFKATALTPYLRWIKKWADIEQESNYFRYDSLSMNGAALYYQSSKRVRDALAKKTFNKPVLVTISEDDSVINAEGVASLFTTRFIHPQSQLIWFGNSPAVADDRITVLPKFIPEQQISTIAHMSVLFSPDNPYYGKNGSYRMCNNGQPEQAERQCKNAKDIWYSAWGFQESGKIHARLTWNPYFAQVMTVINQVIQPKTEAAQ